VEYTEAAMGDTASTGKQIAAVSHRGCVKQRERVRAVVRCKATADAAVIISSSSPPSIPIESSFCNRAALLRAELLVTKSTFLPRARSCWIASAAPEVNQRSGKVEAETFAARSNCCSAGEWTWDEFISVPDHTCGIPVDAAAGACRDVPSQSKMKVS
jgi:hypothetical protein